MNIYSFEKANLRKKLNYFIKKIITINDKNKFKTIKPITFEYTIVNIGIILNAIFLLIIFEIYFWFIESYK